MKAAHIRPPDLMAAKEQCVEHDRRLLLDRRNEWHEVSCPACDAANSTLFGEKNGFIYVECKSCGTVYTNPRPSEDLLRDMYVNSENYAYWNRHIFPVTEEVRRERIFRPRAQRVVDYCHRFGVRGGTLLEIGAAFGTFCTEVASHKMFERIVALEPTPDLAATCRERGFEVAETSIELYEQKGAADVVAAFEVLEHIHSPIGFVERCWKILRPGGLLFLTCPNVKGFDLLTLGVSSGSFDHEHLNYFHPKSVSLLLERARFRICDVATPGRLDADIVRERITLDPELAAMNPFLNEVLVERWSELGEKFQDFLAAHRLSSHMWIVGAKEEGSY